MTEQKSFHPSFRLLDININTSHQKSKSLSSKSLDQQSTKLSPDKKAGFNLDQNAQVYSIHEKTFPSSNSKQKQFLNRNQRPRTQMYENLFQHKKIPTMSPRDANLYRSNLYRSKSVHEVYQHHRISMLHQINNFLEDHLKKNKNQEIQRQAKLKSEFQIQIIAKLDKLEKYLHKIKSQRQKEQKPKQVTQNECITKNIHEKKNSTYQITLPVNTPTKNQYQRVLSELDKIKSELAQARTHAIQIKERNSFSKKKKQNPQTQEVQAYQIKTIRPNINRQAKQNHSNLGPSQKYVQIRTNSTFYVNQNSPQARVNNHFHQNQFQPHIYQNLNLISRSPANNIQKGLLKQKITFSFGKKA